MAEELQHYTSAPDSTSIKRKYEEPPSSTASRRATGFSAPVVSQSPDPGHAYSSGAPHIDEIEIAKQRAQEIAARLFNNAESKRSRVENVAAVGGGGYDSSDASGYSSGIGQNAMYNMAPSMLTSYGNQGPNKKIEIPNGKVGVIIGKGGETIKYLQLQSGAKIQITRDMDADPHSTTRAVELVGTSDQIARAEQLINDVLAEADSGGAGRRMTGQPGGSEQFVMKVPTNKVGLVIGKGGETIKTMQASSGARIQVIPLHPPPGDTSTERTVQIDGTAEQIEAAKQLVNEVVNNENRARNQAPGGGYSQQGYQTQQQASWAPPAQQQNYGYGYNQAQYSMPQQAYPNTGYPPAQQTAAQAGSGDYSSYYNQPPPPPPQQQITPPGGSTDNTSAYNYSTPGYGNASNQTAAAAAAAAAAMYQQGGYYNYPQSGYAQMPYAAQYAAGSYYGAGGGGGGYQQPPAAAYSGDGSAGGTYDAAPPAAAPAQPTGPAKTSPQS